jgi:MGT family glycosyltransferase
MVGSPAGSGGGFASRTAATIDHVGDRSPGRHVLVLPYPSWGHVLPTLGLAGELLRRGHRITYAVDDGPIRDRVAATGARTVPYGSPLMSTTSAPDSWTDDSAGRALVQYMRELVAATGAIEGLLGADPPDLLLYDCTVWAPGRVLGRTWRRPTLQVFPVFASNEHWSLMRSQVEDAGHPELPAGHPAVAEAREVMDRFLAARGIDPAELDALVAGRGEHALVLLPRALQPAGETFDDTHAFVGPCDEHVPGSWEPPGDPALPLVLVSLGTVVADRPDFYRYCVDELARLPRRVVIVAGDVPVEVPDAARERVSVVRWVDFDRALPHASVFVTHAGMGSVLAAGRHGVPVVAVPFQPEQRVNADRLVELGMGRHLAADRRVPGALREAVLAVTADPGPARAAARLGREIAAAGGARRAADVVENRMERIVAGTGGR